MGDRGIAGRMRRLADLEPRAIRAAVAGIDAAFTGSPQFVHEMLSERLGVPVIVKVECVNPIRSFKGRGTSVAMQALVAEARIGSARPVVCASAGNFGQGVAIAGRSLGVPVVVFTSLRANRAKVARMRALGAEVIETGDDFDTARAASETYASTHDCHLLVDGADPRISTGAATLALEVTDAVQTGALPAPVMAMVPVGNGSLINGIGAWMAAELPSCQVVGIQSDAAPAMTLSWRAGRPIDTESADSVADGIATRVSLPLAVELMVGRVDDMRLVTEDQLLVAQQELSDALGITVETSAAVGWAALVASARPAGPVLLIITGSNV
jgi:threonine dehydratase